MTGGLVAAVHRLTVVTGAGSQAVVLRQYQQETGDPARRTELAGRVLAESRMLDAAAAADLLAPEVLAVSATGGDTGGHPAIVMTRLPGHVFLSPTDPRSWLRQIAATAARIHHAPVAAPGYQRWTEPERLTAPASSSRPGLWQAMRDVLCGDGGSAESGFIHRDFQHFNFLWRRGRLTGVVDWGYAATGPPSIDTGHCRLNLAVLFSADWAEQFRLAYEAEAGRRVDPWWDLEALASYSDHWRDFIPIQVDGRAPVDGAGMTARVEEVLAATLGRL